MNLKVVFYDNSFNLHEDQLKLHLYLLHYGNHNPAELYIILFYLLHHFVDRNHTLETLKRLDEIES